MRIIVTGGAGCLGSNLIERWLPRGHQVLVIENFATGHRDVLPEKLDGLAVVEGSIADATLVDRCFAEFGPTHVVHCAAAYKDPSNWREDASTNISGTINIARACEAAGVNRLVNFQTALCYGRPDSVPISIDAPLRPFTSYGISKTAGEQYLMMADVPALSFRLANVTGPRLAIGPIPTFYRRLKTGQPCFCSGTIRDFLDMEDFLVLMDLALEDDAPTGVFNVSTGEGKTIKDVYDAVAHYLGIDPPDAQIVPPGQDDVPAVVLDPSATEAAFAWRARVSFRDTIRRMLAWYDEHGVTAIYSHLAAPAAAHLS
ncbi:MAG: nucleotide sugar epimerase [Methyloceanibacter sp.]|nr:MAG: nucleotide sugar epimerase [Methyloceanibacter sp.]